MVIDEHIAEGRIQRVPVIVDEMLVQSIPEPVLGRGGVYYFRTECDGLACTEMRARKKSKDQP